MSSSRSTSEKRRATGRVSASNVRSNFGTVIEASAGGLRIKGKAPSGTQPGSVLSVQVESEGESIELACEVRWIQRHPFRGATFGVSFIEIDDEQRRELFSLIRRAGADTRCRWDAA